MPKLAAWGAILLFMLFSSCNKENAPDCFQKAGDHKLVRREVAEWNRIELRDYIQFELVDSAQQFIEIEGPGNLLGDIETSVKDGQLLIRNNNTCNFVRSYKHRITVRIFSPSFPDIQNYGTGDVRSLNRLESTSMKIDNRDAAGNIQLEVNTDSMTVATHTGVCDVVISGHSEITTLFNQGLGVVDARNLESTDSFVNNSSINDVYVNSNGYFYGHITYSGNIYYTGTPNFIDSNILGSGRILKLEQ
jgi:hypothetical protein